jgi:hypothetical protein
MAALGDNWTSDDLALLASRLAGGAHNFLAQSAEAFRQGKLEVLAASNLETAQVYATLALVQAVRELTTELHGAHAGHE